MIIVFSGRFALGQPPSVAQFLAVGTAQPPPPPPVIDTANFYIDKCLVKRDDRPRYSYN